ncbi:hypothetical protein [Pseudooceanicola onchidii]|uniref:hypothetical protein n=1 Tax=Pseudooceanicola onchidii TaxID=2562279 RepID=UPI0010AA0264|nr:hypothetical protein [Pseudooceanicola onchidii]
MQDKTINNALLALRKQIIREGGDGLDHVEALLAMRGVDMPRVLIATARRGEMGRMVLDALRDGPKTRAQLVEYIGALRPDVPTDRLYWRVDGALSKLRGKIEGGPVWRLTP